jgi:methylmalonyl-CoA epimerase
MNERILDHVGIAVPSLDLASPIWSFLAGAPSGPRECIDAQRVEVVFLGDGPGRIELLAPTGPDSAVARFLERRGPGVHHICFRVPDIRAAAAEHLANGFELVDPEPGTGAGGHQVLFLNPRTAGGVLVELLERVT